MNEDFDPRTSDRVSRERGFKKETEQIIYYLRNRGDQRIGQLLINAVREHYEDEIADLKDAVTKNNPIGEMNDDEFREYLENRERAETARKAKVEDLIWNIEAPELVEALKTMDKKEEVDSQ